MNIFVIPSIGGGAFNSRKFFETNSVINENKEPM